MKFGIFTITLAFAVSSHAFGLRSETYSCSVYKDGKRSSGSLQLTANDDGSRGGSAQIAGLKVRVVKYTTRVPNREGGFGGFMHDLECGTNPLNVFNRRCYPGTHKETMTELQVTSIKGNEAREAIDIEGSYDENDDGTSLKSIGTYQANGQASVDLLVRCSQD